MQRNSNIRRRILKLIEILQETDEFNTRTMPELIQLLGKSGISADRRVIYEDIEEINLSGQWEILRAETGKRGYFLASRIFDDAEINILADGLRASRFLSEGRTNQMLNKLSKLTTPTNRRSLQMRTIKSQNGKSDNGKVLYYVDRIEQAIRECRAVTFFSYRIDSRKRREYLNGGEAFTLYPVTLIWFNDNYYMIALDDNWDYSHIRVDRMAEVSIADTRRWGIGKDREGKLDEYVRHTFGIEAGKPIQMTLECDSSISDEIYEKFGMAVAPFDIKENCFRIRIKTSPSSGFFGWIFAQNGKVRILEPQSVREDMKRKLKEMLSENRL